MEITWYRGSPIVNYLGTLSGRNTRVIFPSILSGETILSWAALPLHGNSWVIVDIQVGKEKLLEKTRHILWMSCMTDRSSWTQRKVQDKFLSSAISVILISNISREPKLTFLGARSTWHNKSLVLIRSFWYLHNTDGLLRIARMQISFYIMNTLTAFSFYAAILPQRHSKPHRLPGGGVTQGSAGGQPGSSPSCCKEIHNTLLPECKKYPFPSQQPHVAILPS